MEKRNVSNEVKNIEKLREMPLEIVFVPHGKEYSLLGLIKHLMSIYIFYGDMPVCFECNRDATFTHFNSKQKNFNKLMAILDAYDDSLGIEVTIN